MRALVFLAATAVAGAPRLVFAQTNGTRAVIAVAPQSDAAVAGNGAASSNTTQPRQRVAVATRTIARGSVLSADDFTLRDTTMRMNATEPDTTPVVAGWVTRRTINAGEVLRSPAVEAPAVVNANSPVLIEWSDGNVSLTVHGIAARNGAIGDRIPVRSDLGKRFEATVVAPGRVRID